jgi:hypothetical protein
MIGKKKYFSIQKIKCRRRRNNRFREEHMLFGKSNAIEVSEVGDYVG